MAMAQQNLAAGRAIRRARDELNMSQGRFAELLSKAIGIDVSQGAVSGWEVGNRQTPAAALIAAADLAGMSVDAALGRPFEGLAKRVAELLADGGKRKLARK